MVVSDLLDLKVQRNVSYQYQFFLNNHIGLLTLRQRGFDFNFGRKCIKYEYEFRTNLKVVNYHFYVDKGKNLEDYYYEEIILW